MAGRFFTMVGVAYMLYRVLQLRCLFVCFEPLQKCQNAIKVKPMKSFSKCLAVKTPTAQYKCPFLKVLPTKY